MAKKYKSSQAQNASPAIWKSVIPWVAAILFFIVLSLAGGSSSRPLAVICVIAALAVAAARFRCLEERFTIPMLALALVVAMGGVSTFYAIAGKFALAEFLKLLISFCAAIVLLAAAPGENQAPGRHIATVLERAAAITGLVSIDLMSTRWISDIVLGFLNLFSGVYVDLFGVSPDAGRMLSMFDTPNAFAGIAGIGVLLSLGLVLSSETGGERSAHVVCLYICSLSFVLAFSMGGIGTIAVGFLVYLLVEKKERRGALLLLMVETLIVTMAAAAAVSATSFNVWMGVQTIPLACTVVGSAILWALDRFVGQKLANKLAKHTRAVLAAILALILALAVTVVLALNLTGNVHLSGEESIRRGIYPAPGEYTISAEMSGDAFVVVETQSRKDTMMHTETILYDGDLKTASFVVPEDSIVVYLTFVANGDATIEKVVCQGAETIDVKLGYKILPEFMARRLQGFKANENFVQRICHFEDGIKIFKRSPVIGLGLGSFENGIKSVQSFYYTTKYAHNHYIQTLAETGVIGLILFVLLLVSSLAAVICDLRKKEEGHTLTPALAAALVFMAGHAAVEVVFSYYAYLPMAFGVFALISMCCPLSLGWFKGKIKKISIFVCGALILVFMVFLSGNIKAEKIVSEQGTWDSFVKAEKMDKFEWADYALSYVLNAAQYPEDPVIQEQAEKYVQKLAKVDSNTIPIYLAEYYFGKGEIEQAMAMLEKYVRYVSSDEKAWNNTFAMLGSYAQETEVYQQGVERIASILEEWQAENIGSIQLNDLSKMILVKYGVMEIPG